MSNTGDKMLLYLAENINGFLSVNNCTEAEAARGAGLNLTTVNNWICKKAYPRWKNLIKLADYFGCPIYELIEDPERREKGQRFLTQWQRSLLAADRESETVHSLLVEICKADESMDEETLEHVFERFYKGGGNPDSNGIGMYLAKQIIQIHNGTIDVQSRLNEGTSFHIRLFFTETI